MISEKYVLEYGTDCLEMHVGAVETGERALVVDDLVATGGTLCAAMNLLGISLQLYIIKNLPFCTFRELLSNLSETNRLVSQNVLALWLSNALV